MTKPSHGREQSAELVVHFVNVQYTPDRVMSCRTAQRSRWKHLRNISVATSIYTHELLSSFSFSSPLRQAVAIYGRLFKSLYLCYLYAWARLIMCHPFPQVHFAKCPTPNDWWTFCWSVSIFLLLLSSLNNSRSLSFAYFGFHSFIFTQIHSFQTPFLATKW